MSTESNDQYCAGFEAWALSQGLSIHRVQDQYEGYTFMHWRTWLASKREASTEPVAYALLRNGKVEGVERTIQCARMWVDATIMPLFMDAGALTDDATILLTAKKAHQAIVDEKKKMEDAYIESSRLHELYWEIKGAERIVAAIEAKAGSQS